LNKLLELERTRTRIATDLHDDIGANLSKISMLSEIVKLKMVNGNSENNRMLTAIAEISRASVDSMRDIVWAINPQRDSVREMIRKMREHAEQTFVPMGVSVRFITAETDSDGKLAMDLRRELFLIYKEAINNAARHSGCSNVEVNFHTDRHGVFLEVNDDGRGIEVAAQSSGNGLPNMKSRAERIGGYLQTVPKEKGGTSIIVSIPQRQIPPETYGHT
jgi:signal transduction histidine kinase